jgi:aspartate racemase
MDFYRDRFTEAGIQTLVPGKKEDREYIEQTLLHELGKGIILDATRQAYLRIIQELIDRGAEGIILGCTEIPLLIRQEDVPIPTFNTTEIHVQAGVNFAFS